MRDLAAKLQVWRAEGLVSPEQAEAIRAYELEHGEASAPRRTLFAEAVGYVGAVLAVAAVGMIVSNLWNELTTVSRLTLVGLLTVTLCGAGAALLRAERAPMQRLASVLFTGAVAGVAWFAGLVATEIVELTGEGVGVVAGGAALAVALPLYLRRSRALHQLTVLAAALAVALFALSTVSPTPEPMWFALTAIGVGGAWFLLASGGWLEPRVLAEISGAAVVLVACQAPAVEPLPWLLTAFGVAAAGGLVGLAVVRNQMHHLVVGAVGLFLLVPNLVFSVFGDAIGAPAALLVIGLLLVLLAVGIGRAGREVRSSTAQGTPREPSPPDREEVPR